MANGTETDQSLKSTLLSPVALAAYVAAAAALVGAYVGYTLGEKQYALELERWRVSVVLAMGGTNVALGHASNLAKSKILSADDLAMICRIWAVPECLPPTSPKK